MHLHEYGGQCFRHAVYSKLVSLSAFNLFSSTSHLAVRVLGL